MHPNSQAALRHSFLSSSRFPIFPFFLVLLSLLPLAGCAGYGARDARSLTAEDLLREENKTQAARELNRGLLVIADGKYEQAISILFPLVRRFESLDNPADAAAASFWTGYCHEKLNQWPDAESFYRLTIDNHPGTPAARQARDRIDLHAAPAP